MVLCGIPLRVISQEVLMNLVCNVFRDYTFEIIATVFQGANEWNE